MGDMGGFGQAKCSIARLVAMGGFGCVGTQSFPTHGVG